MGDVAMLQVAVRRLQKLWPSAEIHVFTEAPEALAFYCPDVRPLSHQGRRLWFSDQALLGDLERHVPGGVLRVKGYVANWLRRRSPALLTGLQKGKARLRHRKDDRRRSFLEETGQADLHLVSGNALLNDKNRSSAITVLETMERAARRGIPVAMVSQGVGPLSDPALTEKARAVLPLVNLVTAREGVTGPALLESLGVASQRLLVTGDDAVEMARAVSPLQPGSGIGVNLRVARSTDVPSDFVEPVRSVLQNAARQFGVPLVPIPIAFHASADDPKWIREILAGFDDRSDGGKDSRTPLAVIEEAGRCRIVVTAAYHAGVFALAQGIPVIALAANEYYELKFRGLADMFRGGCEVVHFQDPALPERLSATIEGFWEDADTLRPALQHAADRQIEAANEAYSRILAIVEGGRPAARAATP
jgi:polysaccharide pyruvyl transferase WcaK-like protein